MRRLHRTGTLAIDDVAQQLLGKQRVPARTPQHVAQRLRRELRITAERAAQQTFALVVAERPEMQERNAVAAEQPAERNEQRMRRDDLVVAVGADQQHAARDGSFGQHVEDPEQLAVGPVEIVERQHRRAALRDAVEGGEHRGQLLVARRRALVERARAVRRAQQVPERAQRPLPELATGRRLDAVPSGREAHAELAHQPRFADPRLAGDQHEAASAFGGRPAPGAQVLQLADAAYELTTDDAFRNHLGYPRGSRARSHCPRRRSSPPCARAAIWKVVPP